MNDDWSDEIYQRQKEFYLAIFRSMKPPENACEEMQNAFVNALNDFCEGIEY